MPDLRAFREEAALPSGEVGPVDFWALRRLAFSVPGWAWFSLRQEVARDGRFRRWMGVDVVEGRMGAGLGGSVNGELAVSEVA